MIKKDLSIDFLGVRFENPFCLSSSPVGNCYEMCKKAYEVGFAGVVFKTIGPESYYIDEVSPRFDKLDKECTSQSADIGQAYLKTIGLKFRFLKLKKFKKQAMLRTVVTIVPQKQRDAVLFVPEEIKNDKEKVEKYVKEHKEKQEKLLSKPFKPIVEFIPGIKEEREKQEAYEAKLKRLGLKK